LPDLKAHLNTIIYEVDVGKRYFVSSNLIKAMVASSSNFSTQNLAHYSGGPVKLGSLTVQDQRLVCVSFLKGVASSYFV